MGGTWGLQGGASAAARRCFCKKAAPETQTGRKAARVVCVVYIDVLFVLNFIINYLLLFASARLSGAACSRLRCALAAGAGAAYATAAFLNAGSILGALWFKLLVACAMVAITFGVRDMRRLLRLFLIFCGLSFAFGGCAFAVMWLTHGAQGNFDVRHGVMYIKLPLGVLLASSALCYLIFSLVFRRSATGAAQREIYAVTLAYGGREIAFHALLDSGNTLCDPLTNHPVMIVEYETVRDVLPDGVRRVLDSCTEEQLPMILPQLPPHMRFQLIPYKTVGRELALLLAFRPDRVEIAQRVRRNMLAAICMQKISDGGAYHALTGLEG